MIIRGFPRAGSKLSAELSDPDREAIRAELTTSLLMWIDSNGFTIRSRQEDLVYREHEVEDVPHASVFWRPDPGLGAVLVGGSCDGQEIPAGSLVPGLESVTMMNRETGIPEQYVYSGIDSTSGAPVYQFNIDLVLSNL